MTITAHDSGWLSSRRPPNDRDKQILIERRLTDAPQTLEELSQVYDVSRERIRQIEGRAFKRVQKAVQRIAGEKLLPA